jgi:hypothetical protein
VVADGRRRRRETGLRRREGRTNTRRVAGVVVGATIVEDAERQTRTFRHRAGNLIAVILTTVKAGAAAEDMVDTNGSDPPHAVAITARGVLTIAGGRRRTAGVTTATVAKIRCLEVRAGAGLGRATTADAANVVALTPLPHTPGPRAHPDHPPGPGLRTTLPDRARRDLAPAHTLGAARAPFRARPERVAAETETVAAAPMRGEGNATIVCLTDRMLIRGRSAIEVLAAGIGIGKLRHLRSARGLLLRIDMRAATNGLRIPIPRTKRFVVCYSCNCCSGKDGRGNWLMFGCGR